MLSGDNGINQSKYIAGKSQNICKLNSTLLNHAKVKEESQGKLTTVLN